MTELELPVSSNAHRRKRTGTFPSMDDDEDDPYHPHHVTDTDSSSASEVKNINQKPQHRPSDKEKDGGSLSNEYMGGKRKLSSKEDEHHRIGPPGQADLQQLDKKQWLWESLQENENAPLLDPLRKNSSSSDNSSGDEADSERIVMPVKTHSWAARVLHKPLFLLFFLSFLSLLNYYDRGAFVGVLPIISDEFNMTQSQTGIIGGAFIVGYSLVSPLVAQMSRYVPSGPLLMTGMLMWVVSTCLCSFASGFWFLVVVRCFTGIGEAAFICLSPSLIDDVAPKHQRTLWLAVFFSMLPIGYSLGYLGAGLIATYSEWPVVFYTEAILAFPFVVICFFLPNVKSLQLKKKPGDTSSIGRSRVNTHEEDQNIADILNHDEPENPVSYYSPPLSLGQSLVRLAKNNVYVAVTLGYCAQTFVLGALTFWLPDYVHTQYELDLGTANYIIGAVTAFCGIFGNLCSSTIVDHMVTKRGKDPRLVSVYMAFIFTTVSLPFIFGAVFVQELAAFLVLMLIGEFFMLFTVTPVNAVFLSCVDSTLRGHSVGTATLMIHLLGDLSSPWAFGAISDATGEQQKALFFMACWLIWTSLFWFLASIFIRNRVRKEIPGQRLD